MVTIKISHRCWQAVSQVKLRHGTTIDHKYDGLWLMYLVKWDDDTTSWEKVTNIVIE
jgi:hypothetical protein